MTDVLQRFDAKTAAGILSRAALALSHGGSNPASRPVVDDEDHIREELISSLREELNLSKDDDSDNALNLLGDALDAQAERLLGIVDTESALARLGQRGDLPSDLYEIKYTDQIKDLFGAKNKNEWRLIQQTIRQPEAEQHYNVSLQSDDPVLVSLFARRLPLHGKLPEVIYLVVGRRDGAKLSVYAAWRVNPQLVDITGAKSLIDVLRLFAEAVGINVTIGNKTGRFIDRAEAPFYEWEPIQNLVKVNTDRDYYSTAMFKIDRSRKVIEASLIYAIDTAAYKNSLK